ncbi:NB-ARC - like 10 [Theobroma cacao]|nr:NB-ARC - like 10 [Theobroma cacao]
MDLATTVAGKVVDLSMNHIIRQTGYIFCYKSKAQNLELKVQDLIAARERVQSSVNAATRKGEEILQNLDEVGIAFGDHEHRGCKVLITSKDPYVLHGMHANRHFRVDALKEEEAWYLFKKTAGDIVEDPHVQSKATDTCRRCAGLPIAIVATAKALKYRTPPEWENALKQLKNPSQTMPADPRSAIELSFNHLANEDLKSAFLLCMRSCHRLKNLFSFSVARGLLQLQEIEMVDCKDMVEIIAEGGESDIGENGATTKIEFRQLQLLTLKQVPKLISFNTSSTTMALFNQRISGTRDYDHLEKQAASYSIRDE